jgi:hypothetical protein
VTGNEVLLTYTMPLPPEETSQERIRVLHSVRCGGAEGTRTPDFLRAKEALSQLSYSPIYQWYYSNKRFSLAIDEVSTKCNLVAYYEHGSLF